jgi:23S rRNA (cytosine1962-C5)-methyltransferase
MSRTRPSQSPSRIMTLTLQPGEAARPLAGHPWIYRNEVAAVPADLEPGALVDVVDHRGRFIGRGYANPASVILARLLTWRNEPIDEAWLTGRISRAIELRSRIRPLVHDSPDEPGATACRLIFSEGDGLPGLIVDRYGGHLVVQALTAGIDRLLPTIVPILERLCRPDTILARHDVAARKQEGLVQEKRWLSGAHDGPRDGTVAMRFLGFDLTVDCLNGQKTGLYLDQADNYGLVNGLVRGGRVLDGACYTGLWSLHAARAGAAEVIGIDQSEDALATARAHAAANGLADRCRFVAGNLFDELKRRCDGDERFDLVILDPPSFVKSRARIADALRGYKEINLRAIKLLRPGGFLLTCSCSYHLRPELFRALLTEAAVDVGRAARLLAWRGQALDHPVLLSLAETDYLKCALLQLE